MKFNNTKELAQLNLEGSKGVNKSRWPLRRGLAEDGMSKAKRPVATVHVLHGDQAFDVWISRTARGSWDLVRLDSTSEGKEWVSVW